MFELKKQEKNTFTFVAKATKEELEKFVNEAYEKNKGRFNVQGFRKGHAPRKVIEQNYGANVFLEDGITLFVNAEYFDILAKNQNIKPVAQPDITISKMDENGLEAEIVVYAYPEVKLGAYTGLEIEKAKNEATDKDVDAELEQVRNRQARYVAVDKVAQKGDFVVIDFVGRMNNKAFDGGSAEDYRLELGSGSFVPGFEEQVEGMHVGEKKTIKIKFPENYVQNLQGKDAEFEVTLNKVEEKQLPELNDEFASNVSEFDTLAEYKADIKKHLQESADAKNKQENEDKILTEIVKNAEIDVPAKMIEKEIDAHVEQVKERLSYQGLSFEDYLKIINKTEKEFRDEQLEPAEKAIKNQLTIYALIKELKIEGTNVDIDNKIQEIATKYNKTAEDYKKTMSKEELNYIANDIIISKLFDYLLANNTLK